MTTSYTKTSYVAGLRPRLVISLEERELRYREYKKIWTNQKTNSSAMQDIFGVDDLCLMSQSQTFMTLNTVDFAFWEFLVTIIYLIYVDVGSLFFGMESVIMIDLWMFRYLCWPAEVRWIVQFSLILYLNFAVLLAGYGRYNWEGSPGFFLVLRSAMICICSGVNILSMLVDMFDNSFSYHHQMYLATNDIFSISMASKGLWGDNGFMNPHISYRAMLEISWILVLEVSLGFALVWYYANEVIMARSYFGYLVALNDPFIFMERKPELIKNPRH